MKTRSVNFAWKSNKHTFIHPSIQINFHIYNIREIFIKKNKWISCYTIACIASFHTYTYFGQMSPSKKAGRITKSLNAQRTLGGAIGQWRSWWTDLPLVLKRKPLGILPVLTSGSQTLSLINIQKSKLMVYQRSMELSILGVKLTERVRNTILRSRTKITDVGENAARLKWGWAGHVFRMLDEMLANIATKWNPGIVRRHCGRPW